MKEPRAEIVTVGRRFGGSRRPVDPAWKASADDPNGSARSRLGAYIAGPNLSQPTDRGAAAVGAGVCKSAQIIVSAIRES